MQICSLVENRLTKRVFWLRYRQGRRKQAADKSRRETVQQLNSGLTKPSQKLWHSTQTHTQRAKLCPHTWSAHIAHMCIHVAISASLTMKSGLLPAYQVRNTNQWKILSAVWVCVGVCGLVSYPDVSVHDVRWDRSWDLAGDGGCDQLFTPLHMRTCWTEPKRWVKRWYIFTQSITSICCSHIGTKIRLWDILSI